MTEYLTEKQISERFNIPLNTLRDQRKKREGLPCVKIVRGVRYPLDAVEAYLAQHAIVS